MDIRYANALRNATAAWAKNRMADAITMQDLRRRPHAEQDTTRTVTAPAPAEAALMQPQLARYGNLGTRLNIFA